MKIAMVSMNAGPRACLGLGDAEFGGQSVVIDCLSRAMSLAGHDVRVSTERGSPQRGHVDLLAEIELFRERLLAEWTRDRPDVAHAHAWMSGKAAVAAARPFGIPVVQTFHGLDRAPRGRGAAGEIALVRRDEEGTLVRAAARIVAASSAEVFDVLKLGANPRAIKFIPCGVDLELFTPRTGGARPHGAFRVATLGRLVPDAGVADVIEALCHVDDVELVIGGGSRGAGDILADPDAQVLAALALERGVAARVAFAGRVARVDVASVLRSVDVVVCAPWYDSIGTVALEAMACGVPVVVSAVGAHVDAVADGLSGLHVPAQAPRQIAYALAGLKADAALCGRFGRYGVERTSGRYGWPRIAAETLDVYASVDERAGHLSRSGA